ncbi:MAG: hypothetical protein COA43_02170 [Robiginitomaculum sp.]|nr:MAG: hypothetical protein COA43_02170 [Robiginitomaculum sp.]
MMNCIRVLVVVITCFWSVGVSAKPVPAEFYSRMPAIYDAAISPNGKYLATVIDSKGKYIVRVFNLADETDKTVRVVSYGKNVKVGWIKWANNKTLLINTRQSEQASGVIFATSYLYTADVDLKNVRILLDPKLKAQKTGSRIVGHVGARQFNATVVDFLPDEPDHILMKFSKTTNFGGGVHKVNVNTRQSKEIKSGSTSIQTWTVDLNHEVRLGEGRREKGGEYRMTIRDATGSKEWRDVSEYPGITAKTTVYGFTENPNEMIIGARNGKNTRGIYVYDLVKKQRTRKLLHHDKYDASGIIKSADGRKIVGATYIADTTVRVIFDPNFKMMMDGLQASRKGFDARVIDITPDSKKILFKSGSPSNPNILTLYDTQTKTSQDLQYDYPEIGNSQQGDVTKIKYAARDGYKITGYLTTPPKIAAGMPFKKLPFIIMPHGGPNARDTKTFDAMAQFMASRGYLVLQMNFRGSTGLGVAHENAGRKNWVIMQEDVEDATRWLIKKGYADPNRVCIVGWSYGGYAALMGSLKNPELYQCAISIAGVTDLKDMIRDMKKYRFGKFSAKDFILRGFEDKDDIRENSPVKRAKELTVPLLLVHGKKDVIVHYDQYTRMKRALKKSGADISYLSFDNGGHSLKSFEDRKKLYETIDVFLAKNLGVSEAAP